MPTFTDTPSGRTVRLVIAVQDGQLSLVSQAAVQLDAPPLDAAAAPAPGGYLELHDEAGIALGRVHVGADFDGGMEVVPEQPGGAPAVLRTAGTDAFTVVVPVPDGAVDVVAVQVGLPPTDGTDPVPGQSFSAAPAPGAVTEIARFRLDQGQA